jgi:cardiolipin synthase
VLAEELKESNWWRVVRSFFVFHVIRHYPLWACWLPMHQPQLTPAEKLFKTGSDRLGG